MRVTIDTVKKEITFEESVELKEIIDFCTKHGYEDFTLQPKAKDYITISPSYLSYPVYPSNPVTPWDNQPYYQPYYGTGNGTDWNVVIGRTINE